MRILVLGCRGQVGADLVKEARPSGKWSVVGLDRTALDLADIEAIPGRLRDFEYDVLINCAAYTQVDAAEADASMAFAVNARAVEALAATCSERRALLLHLSTDYVFDGTKARPYRPEDAPGPLSVYGASKLAGEALARKVYPEGTVIIRTSSVFGTGVVPDGRGNFVETMLKLGRERPKLRVVADNTMAPTFSGDLARAILDLIDRSVEPDIYHLTNEGRTSWHGLAAAALDLAGLDVEIEPIPASEYPTPARRPTFSLLDTSSATDLCGPMPHWKGALERYLALRPPASIPAETQET